MARPPELAGRDERQTAAALARIDEAIAAEQANGHALADEDLDVGAIIGSNPPSTEEPEHIRASFNHADADVATCATLEPADIVSDFAAPALRPDDFPQIIARYADLLSRAAGHDFGAYAMAMTGAAAAAIDDDIRICLVETTNWYESARLWVLLIGSPASAKTPALRAANRPIVDRHKALYAQWAAQCKALGNDDPIPERPATFTSDATIEAIADTLRANPRGVLFTTDELDSWLGSHDLYSGGAGSRDRGEWLRLFEGGPHQVDRIKRGANFIPNWGASIVSATTFAALRRSAKALPVDGLLQRFLVVSVPPMRPTDESVFAFEVRRAQRLYSVKLGRLFEAVPQRIVRLSPEAATVFLARRDELRVEAEAFCSLNDSLGAHIAKHAGLLGRLMLVFHALDVDGHPADSPVSDATARRAVGLLRRLAAHATAIYTCLAGESAGGMPVVRAMGLSMLADRPAHVSRTYFTNECKAFRNAPEWSRSQAITFLVDAGWLIPDETSRLFNGAPSRFLPNPAIYKRFGKKGEAHRQRREAVRRAIKESRAEP